MRQIGLATLHHGDCGDILPTIGEVCALVTDPPYGITGGANIKRGDTIEQFDPVKWDNEPVSPQLLALCRSMARHHIIWGGNYFDLPPSKSWLVWDKKWSGQITFGHGELAWTNLNHPLRIFRRHALQEDRTHPTQKPVSVMEWSIGQLPDDVTTIIDPFMGSGSTGCAAVKMGLKFIGIEREEQYFDTACRRIEQAQQQKDLFYGSPIAREL